MTLTDEEWVDGRWYESLLARGPLLRVLSRPTQPRARYQLPLLPEGSTSTAAGISRSAFNEGQKIGVDDFGLGGRHAVRETLVGLQRTISQQLG